uniref:Cyclin N-terminal domain-containing protein n=1 Tax=Romanomermis culicivorax TaxID=13658 RepID=A0A915JMF3_ROMCU
MIIKIFGQDLAGWPFSFGLKHSYEYCRVANLRRRIFALRIEPLLVIKFAPMNGQSSLVASQNVNINNDNKQFLGSFDHNNSNNNNNNENCSITNSCHNGDDNNNREQSAIDERVDLPPSREFVYPKFDAAVFDDDRPLGNLLKAEERSFCQISCKYFQCVQVEVEEHMRRTLTEWMLEVSDAERCDCEVFPLAVSYLDRFLSIEPVHKSQLQVLGTACLFVASKIKQPQPLCAKRLIDYSDKFVNINELMSWELLLLNRLRWDLITVTSGDITDHLLHRLRLPPAFEQKLRPQLQIYAALIATGKENCIFYSV